MIPNFDSVNFWVKVAAKNGDFVDIPQSHRILGMSFTDVETKADKLKLKLYNYDLHHIDSPIWRLGNQVQFGWGYGGIESPPRTATIDEISGGVILNITASGQELDVNKVEIFQAKHENVTRSEVARRIAKEAFGFTDDQLFIQDSKIVYPTITHANMTAGRLLRLMADRLGWEYYTDFDGFHFHERVLNQRPQLTLKYVVGDREGSDILDFNMGKKADAFKAGAILIQGRDPLTKEDIEILISNDSVERDTLGNVVESPSAADGEAAADVNAQRVGTHIIVASRQQDRASIKQAGEGAYKKKQTNAIALGITTRGIPGLLAKGTVRIEGISPTMDGPYYVKEVSHDGIAKAPYKCKIKLIRDAKYVAAAPTEEPLAGQGEGVQSKGNVNDKRPAGQDELELKVNPDGTTDYVAPGRQINF